MMPPPAGNRRATVAAVATLLALFAGSAALAADAPGAPAMQPASPRIGLALSGGGARGIAHIGVLKVLEELRVPVHCVTGTSMGSIVGGTFAAGTSPAKLEEFVLRADWDSVFRDRPPREEISVRRKFDDYKTLFAPEFGVKDGGLALPKGVIAGVSIEAFFRVLTTPAFGITDFRKLPIPFRAMATDIETGESVVLDHGSVAEAMRASMSVPGAIAPIEIDGRLLVDGGIANNLPIDEARKLCADVVIAVNISTPPLKRKDITSALSVAAQLVNFLGKQTVDDQLKSMGSRDVLIAPDLGDISASKFDRSADAIRIGEQATRAMADSLKRYSLPPEQYAALRATQVALSKPLGTVDEIRFEGLTRTNPEVLRSLVHSKPGEPLSEEKIGADLRRIYGRGDFESIGYHLAGDGPRAMVITPQEKAWGGDYLRFGLGLQSDFQGDNAFNALVQYRRTWLNHLGGEWLTEFQVGQDTHLTTEFYQPLNEGGIWFVRPYGQIGQLTRGVFEGNDKIAEYLVGSGSVGPGRRRRSRHLGPGPPRPDMVAGERASGYRGCRIAVGQGNHGGTAGAALDRPARPRVVPDQWIYRERHRLRGDDIVRIGAKLSAPRGPDDCGQELGPAHAECHGLRGHRPWLRHARLRVLHARRAAAPVRVSLQPVCGS